MLSHQTHVCTYVNRSQFPVIAIHTRREPAFRTHHFALFLPFPVVRHARFPPFTNSKSQSFTPKQTKPPTPQALRNAQYKVPESKTQQLSLHSCVWALIMMGGEVRVKGYSRREEVLDGAFGRDSLRFEREF